MLRSRAVRTVSKGAKALIDESVFPLAKEGTTYVAPQVLVNVDHSMKVMSEETFGPVMGIMKVRRLPRSRADPFRIRDGQDG